MGAPPHADQMRHSVHQRFAVDAVVRGWDGGVAVIVEPAVRIGVLVEIGFGPLEALSPVGVVVGGKVIGVGGSAEEFVGVGEEIRVGVERREDGEEKQSGDGDPADDGAREVTGRGSRGEDDAEGVDGKKIANTHIDVGEDGCEEEERNGE